MRSVELFAGGGGLVLGTHLAGFTTEVVAEWDRWACDTLRENRDAGYPLVRGVDVREGDVRSVDWSLLPEGVDLVSGGPLVSHSRREVRATRQTIGAICSPRLLK